MSGTTTSVKSGWSRTWLGALQEEQEEEFYDWLKLAALARLAASSLEKTPSGVPARVRADREVSWCILLSHIDSIISLVLSCLKDC